MGKAPSVVWVDTIADLPRYLLFNEATGPIIPIATVLHDVEDVARGIADRHPAIVARVDYAPQAWSPNAAMEQSAVSAAASVEQTRVVKGWPLVALLWVEFCDTTLLDPEMVDLLDPVVT